MLDPTFIANHATDPGVKQFFETSEIVSITSIESNIGSEVNPLDVEEADDDDVEYISDSDQPEDAEEDQGQAHRVSEGQQETGSSLKAEVKALVGNGMKLLADDSFGEKQTVDDTEIIAIDSDSTVSDVDDKKMRSVVRRVSPSKKLGDNASHVEPSDDKRIELCIGSEDEMEKLEIEATDEETVHESSMGNGQMMASADVRGKDLLVDGDVSHSKKTTDEEQQVDSSFGSKSSEVVHRSLKKVRQLDTSSELEDQEKTMSAMDDESSQVADSEQLDITVIKNKAMKNTINSESDVDLFSESPKKRKKLSSGDTKKTLSKTANLLDKGKVTELHTESEEEVFEENEVDGKQQRMDRDSEKRTKSTEEISKIVNEIKDKIRSPKHKPKKDTNNDSMFTESSADSENLGDAETSPEKKVAKTESAKTTRKSDSKTPKKSEGKTPKKSDSKTPKKSDSKTPMKLDGETSKESVNKTPKTADSKTPKKSDSKTPKKSDSKTPKKSDSKTPNKSDSKTPKMSDGKTSDSKTPEKADSKTPKKSDSKTPKKSDSKTPKKSDSKTPSKLGREIKANEKHNAVKDSSNIQEIMEDHSAALKEKPTFDDINESMNKSSPEQNRSPTKRKTSAGKSPSIQEKTEEVNEFIPSSQKKKPMKSPDKQMSPSNAIEDTGSESDIPLVPDIGRHIKSLDKLDISESDSNKINIEKKVLSPASASKTAALAEEKKDVGISHQEKGKKNEKSPMSASKRDIDESESLVNVNKETNLESPPKRPRRSIRAPKNFDSDSDVSLTPRQTRQRSTKKPTPGAKTETPGTGKKSAQTDGGNQSETDGTDMSDFETKSARRRSIAVPRMTAIKEKEDIQQVAQKNNSPALSKPEPKTPDVKAKPARKLSASTSKKVVQKVEQARGMRKRRLSSEMSDVVSTDSEISFPKLKKVSLFVFVF